jgi:hypothetical protein
MGQTDEFRKFQKSTFRWKSLDISVISVISESRWWRAGYIHPMDCQLTISALRTWISHQSHQNLESSGYDPLAHRFRGFGKRNSPACPPQRVLGISAQNLLLKVGHATCKSFSIDHGIVLSCWLFRGTNDLSANLFNNKAQNPFTRMGGEMSSRWTFDGVAGQAVSSRNMSRMHESPVGSGGSIQWTMFSFWAVEICIFSNSSFSFDFLRHDRSLRDGLTASILSFVQGHDFHSVAVLTQYLFMFSHSPLTKNSNREFPLRQVHLSSNPHVWKSRLAWN